MDAVSRPPRVRGTIVNRVAGLAACLAACFATTSSLAAGHRTQNFLVEASSPRLAREVGEAAERYRHELAVYWTGKPLGKWPNPCPIRVVDGPRMAAQGVTQYDRAPVGNFVMEVVGTRQRILDSVLPHEVSHTVLATHFGRPLPRWADEGICSTVEHESERAKHEAKLQEFLRTRRGIAMNRLFLLTEYPPDVLPMYAQGYSVCQFLIRQRGPREFISFLEDYMRHPSWTDNVRKHYGYESLGELQENWVAWVSAGSGAVDRYAKSDPSVGGESHRDAPRSRPSGVSPQGRTPGVALASARGERVEPVDGFYVRNRDGTSDRDGGVKLAAGSGKVMSGDRAGTLDVADSTRATPVRVSDSNRTPVPRSMIPPSIRDSGRYSAAQPQPERGGPARAVTPTSTPWAGGDGSRWR